MASAFEDLEAGGEGTIERWIVERYPEGLKFDCKRKQDVQDPTLKREDRRILGKAISAFANSEGGTLLFGVEARTENKIDGVIRKYPIAAIDVFRNNVEQAISDLISPPISGLKCHTIYSSDNDGSGFLTIEVPASEGRPHMSRGAGENAFYFRNGHQSLPMEVFQIRDQMLRRAVAGLEFRWDACVNHEQVRKTDLESGRVPVSVELYLENNSSVSARFPYLIVRFDRAQYLGMGDSYRQFAIEGLPIIPSGLIGMRPIVIDQRSHSKDWEFSGGIEVCVHPGTKQKIASIQLVAPAAISIDIPNQYTTAIPEFRSLQTVIMDVSYGCQDSACKRSVIKLSGGDLQAKLFENGQTGPIAI